MRHEELTEIILEIKEFLGPNTETLWSRYNNVNELVSELEDILQCLLEKDASAKHKISDMFAPTGSLQEIALSNGWGEAFIKRAERIEKLLMN